MISKKLNIGDTIGLIAPAGPLPKEEIDSKIEYLENLGFKTCKGKYIYDKLGYLAGTDKHRAWDLMDMFLNPEVCAILSVRGGYGSMRMLPYIDFNIIEKNPKIFIGFSDITALLNSIYKKTSLITFHGPMLSSNLNDELSLNSMLNILTGKEFISESDDKLKIENSGLTEGILVGGNLCLISSLLGTDYEIDIQDKILFIEDVFEPPYKIDRMLTSLLLANKLQNVKGFILGQFTDCSLPHYERSLTLQQVIEDRILSLNKPTISNFMSGHSYPKFTVPIGAKIKLDCINGEIALLENVVK
ncbi:MAG: LD-carboxypeptidase [Clostridiaceae bacterium]